MSEIAVTHWIFVYIAQYILMAWCFSTRASGANVLGMRPCVSSSLWVKARWKLLLWQFHPWLLGLCNFFTCRNMCKIWQPWFHPSWLDERKMKLPWLPWEKHPWTGSMVTGTQGCHQTERVNAYFLLTQKALLLVPVPNECWACTTFVPPKALTMQ